MPNFLDHATLRTINPQNLMNSYIIMKFETLEIKHPYCIVLPVVNNNKTRDWINIHSLK